MKRIALIACLLLLSGCGLSMDQQRKYTTYAPSSIWSDGASARPLPAHVVPQDDPSGGFSAAHSPKVTAKLLQRGQQQYNIYCAPCHGLDGRGDGRIVQRGFPAPPSFYKPKLLQAKAGKMYGAITDGFGVMYSYADRVAPRDRWAIIAYIRALQLSQHATLEQAPEAAERLK